jgi:hypothetical protein
MILNTFAVLTAFVGLLRLLLGVLVIGMGVAAWPARNACETPEGRTRWEDRCYLVFLLAVLMVGLNLVSWPLLYLLLQSYVQEWPGVMCIYGVTQVGEGTLESSRFLPGLLRLLQLTKPALVFAGGAWFVLYLLNRRTRTAPLLHRLFVALLPLGGLAVVDSAAELAYVVIPKKEVFPDGGCCLASAAEYDADRFQPTSRIGTAGRPWLSATCIGLNLGLILSLIVLSRGGSAPGPLRLMLLLLAGLLCLATSALFLVEIASPTLLQLPYHHCAYDLVAEVPEAVVAIVLYLAGALFLGWACVARWFGDCPETAPFLAGTVRQLLRLSLGGFLASTSMLALELALA